jgi:hypothetical protein
MVIMKRAMAGKHPMGIGEGLIVNSTGIKKPRLSGVFIIDGIE